MAQARFEVDTALCTGCGTCLAVCPGNMVGGDVLRIEEGHPIMVDQTRFGWQGCWRCQHCLAVCPQGAISILGISPNDVSAKPAPSIAEELPKLMRFRRSCRAFTRDEVDAQLIDSIVEAVGAVPTGGNNQELEFSVVYSRAAMKRLHDAVFDDGQLRLVDDADGDDFSDLRLYDASHLFIAHKEVGERFRDGAITEMCLATAYFELLANACGLGTVITTYAAELLAGSREALDILQIPESHQFMTVVAFGYPQHDYVRGIKKAKTVRKII